MIAVDTNVVVRLLTGDDPKQAEAARSLFSEGPVWIAKTVLLETAWVLRSLLRSLYGLDTIAIRNAFVSLLGLKNVHTEDKAAMAAALVLTVQGLDLADAMHLSGRPPVAVFVSFDRSFVQRAKRAGVTGVSAA